MYLSNIIKAFIINCTLKPSPKFSNTEALIDKAVAQLQELGAETDVVRLVDFDVKPGTSSDEGNGDQWPILLEKIEQCDIFIIATPIWMGHLASTAQRIIERLDDVFYNEELADKETGQFFPYNKVAGCLITGDEDGAHSCAAQTLWAMQEVGFTIPPNVNAYWVGEAGGSKNYVEAGGEKYYYTNYSLSFMTANLVWFAQLLKDHPIPTNLNQLRELAKTESEDK